MAFPSSKHYNYLPVSVLEETESSPRPRSDLEAPPKYSHVEEVDELDYAATRPAKRPESWKKAAALILIVGAVLYLAVSGFRNAFERIGSMRCSGHKLPNSFTLPSGDQIPSVALGVWLAEKGKVGEAVKTALKNGYRHIDGAWAYGNEAEVGEALRESGIPRKEVWITSKLWNAFHAPGDIEPVLDESLSKLGTDYVDLYLIHWPVAFKKDTDNEVDWNLTDNPYPTWQKLEELVEKGKIRNIGISNFNIRRIQNLTSNPLKVRPAVNQVELSYWNPQPELVKWSKENGLLLEAYSPLGSAERVKETLEVPEVKKIAKILGITPAQVYISWHVQRGTVVLPKSVTPSRIEENFRITRLPQPLFDELEKAATSHKPERSVDPSERWGVDIWN
ncbi:aldo-keto reductase [Ephemerocybe angulata]|uniref:Aldo-keto reductase n=1 Tax=Ephemerocybe angulata TaxID=980116 RepID=A0A8H6I0W0_9AGAR|nr:aldo-keto reductase [Tulosesus angulatus]